MTVAHYLNCTNDDCEKFHCVERRDCAGKMSELRRQNEVLLKAVEFYAGRENWLIANYEHSEIRADQSPLNEDMEDENYASADNWHGGKRARSALAQVRGGK